MMGIILARQLLKQEHTHIPTQLQSLQVSFANSYSFHVTFSCPTGQLNVAVTASPPGVVRQVFSSVNLTCSVSGLYHSPLSYQWTSTCTGSNCFVLSGSTPMLSESSLHSVDSGNHTCLVTDALGNSGSATVEILVTGKRNKTAKIYHQRSLYSFFQGLD